MSNQLTGDFDAVLLVRVSKINAILATLHQNRDDEDASPTFPYSVTLRIGDPPSGTHPHVGDHAGWFNELLALDDSGGGGSDGAAKLLDKAPPGASRALREAYDSLQTVRFAAVDPLECRGTARAQLSAPSISLPAGTTSEITVHVHARAHYTGDPGTLALPEPIHGEVRTTYSLMVKQLQHYGSAKKILEVGLPQDDSKIQFHPAPGTGLSPFDFAQLLAEIRKVVREGFEPVNTELPDDFPFRQFKELGGGQALALPVQLPSASEKAHGDFTAELAQPVHLTSDSDVPAGDIQSVSNQFLGPSDFALAVSEEYVTTAFQGTIDTLEQYRQDFTRQIDYLPDPTYQFAVTSAKLLLNNGSMDLSIKGTATSSDIPYKYFPFNNIVINQRLTLVSFLDTIVIAAPDDELTISGLPGGVKAEVRHAVIIKRNEELPKAQTALDDMLRDARTGFNDALRSFDDSASINFRSGHSEEPGASSSGAIAITPDGIILRGTIATKARTQPVATFEQTPDGSAFTAHQSWIPAGRITRFAWSWIMQNPATAWGQHRDVRSVDHSFIFPKPLPPPGPFREVLGDVCLRIEGDQTDASGIEHAVSGGESCSVSTPDVAWRMPAWSDPLITPIWLPDIPPDGILEEAISGHVNVLAHAHPTNDLTANSLIHFADPRMDQPLEALGQGLARVQRKNASLLVIVVLASGTFGGRRREVEANLGSLGEAFRGRVLLTEDYTGSWQRTFASDRKPSTYLINGRGEFVWEYEGVLESDRLAAALDEHFASSRSPRSRPLRLTVQPGDRAPHALFTDDRGQLLALRKLRGHQVLLNFFQSWSAPCLRELRRLQRLHEQTGERAPVIVAVNGAEGAEVLSAVRRGNNLTFALVHDSKGLIARRFGVHCWPTTVSIDPDGIVDHVQLGMPHERAVDARAQA